MSRKDELRGWLSRQREKTELEQIVEAGVYGVPEIGLEEKRRFLGEFRERVIKVLRRDQLTDDGRPNREFADAMKHPAARRLVVRSDAVRQAGSYLRLAREHQLGFKTVSQPDLQGDVVMLIAADKAVNEQDIWV